ncbi:uncharacterized protein BDZ83DRAFT_614533 [Colletotrichum acutatum]|uniref:Uncharacterized protein n=1 Tax=Glomerella acutata TaxID=27357 RepID=A0AAD8USJ7_GLOAC|nr:uncharacterized protein BDZ83DRAFT_614533 [Colletotrichum acutatum]KAK1726968.1 hypothetical protein BDZ83DRAFT_614533 [Colletotrichum acutatum]
MNSFKVEQKELSGMSLTKASKKNYNEKHGAARIRAANQASCLPSATTPPDPGLRTKSSAKSWTALRTWRPSADTHYIHTKPARQDKIDLIMAVVHHI